MFLAVERSRSDVQNMTSMMRLASVGVISEKLISIEVRGKLYLEVLEICLGSLEV